VAAWRTVFVLVAAISCAGCSDEQEFAYPDLVAAKQAGARDHGLIPNFLPPDAQDIRQVFNVDLGITWGCFHAPRGPDSVRERLTALQAERMSANIDPSRFRIRDWWPDEFRGTVAEVYALKDSGWKMRVGIDAKVNTVCYFRGRP
jgi:hypothetical protein